MTTFRVSNFVPGAIVLINEMDRTVFDYIIDIDKGEVEFAIDGKVNVLRAYKDSSNTIHIITSLRKVSNYLFEDIIVYNSLHDFITRVPFHVLYDNGPWVINRFLEEISLINNPHRNIPPRNS